MNHTAQAILAIRLLQSLPNWDRVATVYGDIEAHLDDLVRDLENNDWDDLTIDDARLAEYKADHAWIDQVIREANAAA
jgi:low affinity Fe/Cu permease